jgi:hypothetical protein
MSAQGKDAIVVLDEMGISEVRMRDALLRLANASGVLTEAVDMSTTAWDDNTALTDEARKRYETTESQLKILKNEVVEVARSLGVALMPILRDAIIPAVKGLITFIDNLTKKFNAMSPVGQKITLMFVGMLAALGPILTILGKLTTSGGNIAKAFSRAGAALADGGGFTGAIKAFLGPAGMWIAAITAIVGAIGTLSIVIGEANKKTRESINASNEHIKSLEASAAAYKAVIEDIEINAQVVEKLKNELYDLVDKEDKTNEEKARMIILVDQLNELVPELNLSIDKQTGLLNQSKQTIEQVTKAWIDQAKAQAYSQRLIALEQERIDTEYKLKAALDAVIGGMRGKTDATDEELLAMARMNGGSSAVIKAYDALAAKAKENEDAIKYLTREYGKHVTEVEKLAPEMEEVGGNFATSFGDGLSGKMSYVRKRARELADAIPTLVRKILGMNSPSKVGIAIGENFGASLASGLSSAGAEVAKTAKGLTASMTSAVTAPSFGAASVSTIGSVGGATINLDLRGAKISGPDDARAMADRLGAIIVGEMRGAGQWA